MLIRVIVLVLQLEAGIFYSYYCSRFVHERCTIYYFCRLDSAVLYLDCSL